MRATAAMKARMQVALVARALFVDRKRFQQGANGVKERFQSIADSGREVDRSTHALTTPAVSKALTNEQDEPATRVVYSEVIRGWWYGD